MTNISKSVFTSNQSRADANMRHASAEAPSLADELIQLDDDFGEFRDISAFMCNAFANALKEHERLNQEIISGARICSDWLQQKTDELRDDIRHVHLRYVAEHIDIPPNVEVNTSARVQATRRSSRFDNFI